MQPLALCNPQQSHLACSMFALWVGTRKGLQRGLELPIPAPFAPQKGQDPEPSGHNQPRVLLLHPAVVPRESTVTKASDLLEAPAESRHSHSMVSQQYLCTKNANFSPGTELFAEPCLNTRELFFAYSRTTSSQLG